MTMRQLNMADPRVAAWYNAVERHSDTCTNDNCAGCRRLEAQRQRLRATPGLLIEAALATTEGQA